MFVFQVWQAEPIFSICSTFYWQCT